MGIPTVSYSFIPCQVVEQKEVTTLFHVKLRQQTMSGIEKLQFDHAQILYILGFGMKKMFFVKILLLLPKFHEKTLSRPGNINFFVQRGGCTSTLFPHKWTQC